MPVFVEEAALGWHTIYLSGGRIGLTVEVDPHVLTEELGATPGKFTK